jgi:hypothetical protein
MGLHPLCTVKGQKDKMKKDKIEIPALQQLLHARAVELAEDRRSLPIRVNTATQRTMAAPLAVSTGSDDGKGLIAAFQLDEAGKVFDFHCYREINVNEIEWPLRMTIEAADGESVTGVIRERSMVIERRFFPSNWNEPRYGISYPTCSKTKRSTQNEVHGKNARCPANWVTGSYRVSAMCPQKKESQHGTRDGQNMRKGYGMNELRGLHP